MIVLDTNVLSEPLRRVPDPGVLAWLADVSDTAITAISVGELLVGVRALPAGRRRTDLERAITDVLDRFHDRVLPYDRAAAERYAGMQERRRKAGRPLSVEDGMIAAICAVPRRTPRNRGTSETSPISGLNWSIRGRQGASRPERAHPPA